MKIFNALYYPHLIYDYITQYELIMLIIIILFTSIISNVVSTTITDGTTLQSMCCLCRSRGLQCVYCELPVLGGTHACDLKNNAVFSAWVLEVNTFISNYLPNSDIFASRLITCQALSYFANDKATLSFATATYNCQSIVPRTAKCITGSAVYNRFGCTTTKEYLGNTTNLPENCYHTSCINSRPYFCYSQAWRKDVTWYTNPYYANKLVPKSKYPCYEMLADRMLQAYKNLEADCSSSTTSSAKNVSLNIVEISTKDTDASGALLYYTLNYDLKPKRISSGMYVWTVCTDRSEVINVLNGQGYSWWSNILIVPRGPCKAYIPFDDQYDICADDIFGDWYASGCSDTLRPRIPEGQQVVIKYPLDYKQPSTNSCETINQNFQCGYKNWIDYFVSSITGGQGITVDYEEYARLQHEYAEQRASDSRSWWSWIANPTMNIFWSIWKTVFLECIEPILLAIIEAIGDIVLEILKTYLDLIQKSEYFINKLLEIITQILDVILQLMALILNIILGILLKLEQHFLIFEYSVLFFFINWKILNNNIVSAGIVIFVMCIFGFDRHSPSLILYFYNRQYDYVNLTQYEDSRFNWNYTLTYHPHPGSDSVTITLPKLNSSLEKYPTLNKTVTLPPLYEIPVDQLQCSSNYIN